MKCPDEIATILLKLTTLGILRTRAYSTNDPIRCFNEADHIHNLPGLIRDFSPDCLDYYWQVERPSFLEQIEESERAEFESLWDELRVQIESQEAAHASSMVNPDVQRARESR